MAPTRPAETPVSPLLIGTGGFGYAVGSALPGGRGAAGPRQGRPRHDRRLGQHRLPPLLWLLVRRRHHPGFLAHAPARHGGARLRRARRHAADRPSTPRTTTMTGYQSTFAQVDRERDARQVHRHPRQRRHPRRADGDAARGPPPLHVPGRRVDRARRLRPRPPHRERLGRARSHHARPRDAADPGRVPEHRRAVRRLRRLHGLLRRADEARPGRTPRLEQRRRARRRDHGAGDRRRRRARLRSHASPGARRDPGRALARRPRARRPATSRRRCPPSPSTRRQPRRRPRGSRRCPSSRSRAAPAGRAVARRASAAGDDAAAVYHLFLMPSIQSDVDGSYVGLDGKIALASGCHYVSELSRVGHVPHALAPLRSRCAPERATRHGAVAHRDGQRQRLLPQVADRRRRVGDDDRRERRGHRRRRVRQGRDRLRRGGRLPDHARRRDGHDRPAGRARRHDQRRAVHAARLRPRHGRRLGVVDHRVRAGRRGARAARGGPRPPGRRDGAPDAPARLRRSSTIRRAATSGRRTRTARGRRPTAIPPSRPTSSPRPTRRRASGAPGTTSPASRR